MCLKAALPHVNQSFIAMTELLYFFIGLLVVITILTLIPRPCKLSLLQQGKTLAPGERILYQAALQQCFTRDRMAQGKMQTRSNAYIVFTNFRVVLFQKYLWRKEYTIVQGIMLQAYQGQQWENKALWGMSLGFFHKLYAEPQGFNLEHQTLYISAADNLVGGSFAPILQAEVSPIDAVQLSAWRQMVGL